MATVLVRSLLFGLVLSGAFECAAQGQGKHGVSEHVRAVAAKTGYACPVPVPAEGTVGAETAKPPNWLTVRPFPSADGKPIVRHESYFGRTLGVEVGYNLAAGLLQQPSLSESEILGQAEARIQKHRTGSARLRLLGPEGSPVRTGTNVEIEQIRHQFLFGSNLFRLGTCRTPADNEAYARRFAQLFNFATLPFYWWSYEPLKGQPTYAATERMLEWCEKNGIKAKGHPLAWNYVDPPWIPASPDQALDLQWKRITDLVARFRGRISVWDVVNEATEYDRKEVAARAPVLTESIRKTGVSEYLRASFQRARAADSAACLVINDYKVDTSFADRVVSRLVADSGAPLYDAVGLQSHQHRGAWPVARIWEVCERFAPFHKPLQFTETTFLSGAPGWELTRNDPAFKWITTPEGEQRQAEEVARFYTVLFSHPAVAAITWWDLSDQGAWQRAPAGLLRADMSPKPAYDALKRLIKEKWWTRTQSTAGEGGVAVFHGFLGIYKVAAEVSGQRLQGQFVFDKEAAAPITVTLKP